MKPFIPFVMSLFMTGMGEIYSGSPQRGIILALIRAASVLAIPFYSITNLKSSYITEIFVSLIFFILVTVFSPFDALYISFKRKRLVVSKYISPGFIIIFALCNFIITIISVSIFFSFFSIIKVNADYPPVIQKGDIALIKKISNQFYSKGEMVFINDTNYGFVRITGLPGENISYNKNRFSIQGSELFLSIFTESELKMFSLTDYDVISETNGSFKYPVIQNRDKFKLDLTLKDNEYFAAPDDRNNTSGFANIKKEKIYGRLEGILFSLKTFKILIKPFQISE